MRGERRRLEKFIKGVTWGADSENKADVFIIRQAMADGKMGPTVEQFKFEQTDGEEHLDSLVEELIETMSNDAAALSGRQRYIVLAMHRGKVLKRMALRIDTEPEEGDSIDSEPATKEGLISQMMRHSETMHRLVVGSLTQAQRIQSNLIERQSNQIEHMHGKHMETVAALEDLHSQKHARELASAEAQERMTERREMFGKITTLLPILANRFLGKKALPEKKSSGEVMIQSLLESLTPEQFESIVGTLRPEQAMLVMELVQRAKAEEERTQNDIGNSNGKGS